MGKEGREDVERLLPPPAVELAPRLEGRAGAALAGAALAVRPRDAEAARAGAALATEALAAAGLAGTVWEGTVWALTVTAGAGALGGALAGLGAAAGMAVTGVTGTAELALVAAEVARGLGVAMAEGAVPGDRSWRKEMKPMGGGCYPSGDQWSMMPPIVRSVNSSALPVA